MKESLITALLTAVLVAFRKEARMNRLYELSDKITICLITLDYEEPERVMREKVT